MQVIAEEPWSFTVFSHNEEWVVTYLIGGVVDVAVSVVLEPEEVTAIKQNPASVKALVDEMRFNRERYKHRELRPAVWPGKQ